MIDVEGINKLYGTKYFICELSRDLIEEALLEKFGSFGYFKYPFPEGSKYIAGTKFEWESYVYESEGSTRDEALSNLLLEHACKPEFEDLVVNLTRN